MASISGMLSNFSSFLQNHQVSFVNGILVLFTFAGEQIFKSTTFQCPCSQPKALVYGCSFLVGSFLVLTILGVVVNNLTWRLCHGCIKRTSGSEHGLKESTKHVFVIFGRALIVPLAWLFVAFLDGNYYACMASNSPCDRSDEYRQLVADSQIISWIILCVVVGSASFTICISRCLNSLTYMQHQYLNIYREEEMKYFDEKMKKIAQEMAKSNVELFTNTSSMRKEDWDKISKAPKHSVELNIDGGPFYTPLHKWSQKKVENNPELNPLLQNSENNYPMEEVSEVKCDL